LTEASFNFGHGEISQTKSFTLVEVKQNADQNVVVMPCPIGREAGHSNILWTGLSTAWCYSTSGNQRRPSPSQTIPRPNIGATKKSERGMQKARPLVTWRGCSIFPCSGSVRLCSNGGSKTPIFPETDERSKPARLCFGDRINGIQDDQGD
jgi:hypothetical protein